MIIRERLFILVSLLIATAGLATLFIGIGLLEQKPIEYDTFTQYDEGIRIVIEGKIKKVTQIGNMTLLDLGTECTLPLIFFENEENLVEEEILRVVGTKKYYEGRPEVLVEKIIKKKRHLAEKLFNTTV